ncbi:MAG TPA: choice-of-anchor Q domain-containing protein [Actinomycetota bacterium]|nr:choice-of-anchor Q domain-containing protein [Actinomycetota bacterium]
MQDWGGLTNNGGPTLTHLPSPTSVAVELNQQCAADVGTLTSDQRGLTRPQGTYCDSGALERDTVPPTTPVVEKPSKRFLKSRDLLFDWTDSTDPGGVGSIVYDPERRREEYNQTNFVNVTLLGGGFESERQLTGKPGSTECFKVVARDGDGNESAESNEKCTATPLDDRDLKAKGTWKRKKGPDHYLETYTSTKQEGAKLSLKDVEDAKRLVLVATRCPDCGKVGIMMDDDLLVFRSLKASSEKRNSFIKVPAFANPTAR